METNRMTIHRALSELKLIDAKIEKQIAEITPTGIKQKGKPINGYLQDAEFENQVRSKFDSVNYLIERKIAIKSAIVKANGEAKLMVAGKEMTIADAINFKAIVNYKRLLVDTLKNKHNNIVGHLNKNNEQVERNVQAILEATFGKENVKAGKDDVNSVRDPYLEANTFHLVDPLKVEQTIESIEKEIGEFEMDVDSALSEINAVTFVEV